MKKIVCFFVVAIIILANIQISPKKGIESLAAQAADLPIVINQGGRDAFNIPADSHAAIETMPKGFVQNDLYKPNLEKRELNSFSVPIYSTVKEAFPLNDGTYLLVLEVDNIKAPSKPYRIATNFVVKTDQNGRILKSKSIPKGTEGLAVDFTRTSGDFGAYSRYYTGKKVASNQVMLYYSGQKPGESASKNRGILVDASLNMTYYEISKERFSPQQFVEQVDYLPTSKEIVQAGFIYEGTKNKDSIEVFTIGDAAKYEKQRSLDVPTFAAISPGAKSPDWQQLLGRASLYDNATGRIAGILRTYNPLSSGVENGYAVMLWDENGRILKTATLAYKNSEPIVQKRLSNGNEYYYLENDPQAGQAFLKKLDMTSGDVTICQTFPFGTNIQIIPQAGADHAYTFYGSIASAEGIFAGYGKARTEGAITGMLNQDFSLKNASITNVNGSIDQTISIPKADGMIFVGGSTTATDFSPMPADGWQNQAALSAGRLGNAYFGSMQVVNDYAPAIRVGGPAVINKDTVTDWDAALLKDVEVTDVFDLATNRGNHSQEWLNGRINRNPLNDQLAYDWAALGLNKEKIGPNRVTYFITDASMQTTASSKIVNVINDSTQTDAENKLAMDGHPFDIDLASAPNLTEEMSKDADHGKLLAWDMANGTFFKAADIQTDQAELRAIQQAKQGGAFPLTFRVTKEGRSVTKSILVYVTDEHTVVDEEHDKILFAGDFSLNYREAFTFSSADVKTYSKAAAYQYSKGEQLPTEKISGDPTPINRMRAAGKVKVTITLADETAPLTTQVTATIINDRTVDPDGGDREPDDKDNLNPRPANMALTYASTIDFGSDALDKHAYNAKDVYFGQSKMKPCVQMADHTDKQAGWKIMVKQPAQFKGADQSELRGAKLKFDADSKSPLTRTDNHAASPVQRSFEITQFNCNYEVMTASAGQGSGIWSTNFEQVTLLVPSGISKNQTYQTSLIWTLANVPE
ncbi:WxL domain-containing protein [Listeria costaricensis]|uniref:WxL domain-containing protein n=1 Tax=Listeria costaricensis TaxID=2026604 RepID=UPI000C083708|nr:WxL domain-containing protein [Listeria costaricensis]